MNLEAGTSPAFHSFESRATSAFSWLILLGGAITAGIAAHLVIASYTALPWSDGWVQIFVAASGDSPFSPHWLWQQHNEHRLLLPKLLLGVDLRWFAAQQKFLLAAIYVVQLVHWSVLAWSMRVLGGWRGAWWRTGAGLAAFCLFCPTQWENLVWGFQTCFVLPPLFASLSFVGLLVYWKDPLRPRWRVILFSLLAAIAASCSLANGLLVLPLLAITAASLGLRRSVVLTYFIAAIVIIPIYFHGYMRPPQSTDPLSALRTPGRLIGYVAAYFGSSWTKGNSWDGRNLAIASAIGLLGLALLLALLLRLIKFRDRADAFSVHVSLLALFCVGTAFLTALGRAASGNGQAFASRYQTIALLFWFSLGCLLLAVSERYSRFAVTAIDVFLLLTFLRGAALVHLPLREAGEHAFQQRTATAALLTGVDDREQLAQAFPDPGYVLKVVPFMRDRRLSIFASGDRALLGAPVGMVTNLGEQQSCEGELQSSRVIGTGDLRITGWAWKHQPATQVFAASNGKISGFGAVGEWRPAVRAAHHEIGTSFLGFTVYAKGTAHSPAVIYAVFGGSAAACEVATVQTESYSDVK
jgi:hypothetical protein